MKEQETPTEKQSEKNLFHGEEQPLNFIFDPEFLDREPEPGECVGHVNGYIHMSSEITAPATSLYWELDVDGKGMVVSRVDGKNDTPKEAHSKKKRKKERRSGRIRPPRKR